MVLGRRYNTNSTDSIDREYRCCHCLHVRAGTILLAAWQILLHTAILVFLIALLARPSLLPDNLKGHRLMSGLRLVSLGERDRFVFNPRKIDTKHHATFPKNMEESKTGHDYKPSFFQQFFGLNKEDEKPAEKVAANSRNKNQFEAVVEPIDVERDHSVGSSSNASQPELHTREDRFLALAVTGFTLTLSGLLLCGGISGRPALIMPYFCLQVFDFVIACLTVIGYFSYLPDIKANIKARDQVPYQQQMLGMDHGCLAFLLMLLGLGVLCAKAYLIGMVWACYKFLVRRANGMERASGFEVVRPAPPRWMMRIRLQVRGGAQPRSDPEPDEERAPLLGSTPPPSPPPECVQEPPKYDEVLMTPANAYMPPPYFKGDFKK